MVYSNTARAIDIVRDLSSELAQKVLDQLKNGFTVDLDLDTLEQIMDAIFEQELIYYYEIIEYTERHNLWHEEPECRSELKNEMVILIVVVHKHIRFEVAGNVDHILSELTEVFEDVDLIEDNLQLTDLEKMLTDYLDSLADN